jgi:hypothetical protein
MKAFFESECDLPLICGSGKNDDDSEPITIRHELQSHFSPLHWKFELIGHPDCTALSDNLKLRLNQIIECEKYVLNRNRFMMIPISIFILTSIILISGICYQFYHTAISIIAVQPMI